MNYILIALYLDAADVGITHETIKKGDMGMKEKECEYCAELFTGDCNNDLITHDLELKINGLNLRPIQFNVFIMDDELELFADCDDVPIIKQKIKINYCPMCGRRLVKNVT